MRPISILDIQHVSKLFGGVKALEDINLQVNAGDFIGLIGPNGSGKTTLLNIITGMYTPSSGDIIFNRTPIGQAEPHEIARLGIARTFQHIRLCNELSALDNIIIGYFGRSRFSIRHLFFQGKKVRQKQLADAEKAVAFVRFFSEELVDRLFDKVKDLPYIDRRRIEICRALVTEPKILLLDEPTAGMNPEETMEVIDDIIKIRESYQDMAIIMIEHDMDVIHKISNRVVCLNYGKKIAEGTFAEVANNQEVQSAYLGGETIA
ncbi:ABC transporter ATP-binding protein [Sporolactobacillus sp. THM7-7]|nr:ABC transporter ATP-binding protein [Sporolactobacillus sp. THM7-7]